MSDRRSRVIEGAKALGADAALALAPTTVAWLSGISSQTELGPSPFRCDPAVLVTEDRVVAIVSEQQAEEAICLGCEVATYPGYSLGELDPVRHFRHVLVGLVGSRIVATEPANLPVEIGAALRFKDATALFCKERAIKDPDEIERLAESIALTDVGQGAVKAYAEPGMTELTLWHLVHAAMERAAGTRLPSWGDLLSGERTALVDGAPSSRVLREGDLVLMDVTARLHGYWADSCSTIAVGRCSDWAIEAHGHVHDRLVSAIDSVGPGMRAGELDSVLRSGLDYPHHSGHGIGASYHEEPRIVPDSVTMLAPGMVIALEPGCYSQSEGIRLEWVVLITETGAEIMSKHRLEL